MLKSPVRLLIKALIKVVVTLIAVGVFSTALTNQLVAAEKQGLKIAVVDMNKILNESKAGRAEKDKLLKERDKLQQKLTEKELEFKNKVDALRDNLLLTEEARKQEESKLREEFQALQGQMEKSQGQLLERERTATERVFKKAEKIVQKLAKAGGFDLVLESVSAVTVLYSKEPLEDITKQVISEISE